MANFAKRIAFFLKDEPLAKSKNIKYAYPGVNHKLAFRYAEALDKLLDWSRLDAEAKPVSLVYLKMVAHSFKHVLHKYKRNKSNLPTHRVFAYDDFHLGEGKSVSYFNYPLIEDLVTLKKEIGRLTEFKIDVFNEVEDKHLELLCIGSLSDLSLYSFREFKRDFEVVNILWEDVVAFAKERSDDQRIKMVTSSRIMAIGNDNLNISGK
jgi:hypothetical protein